MATAFSKVTMSGLVTLESSLLTIWVNLVFGELKPFLGWTVLIIMKEIHQLKIKIVGFLFKLGLNLILCVLFLVL